MDRDRNLDPVQVRILAGVAQGYTDQQIADEVGLSVAMVKFRFQELFTIAGVRTRAAVLWRYRKIVGLHMMNER